MLLVIFGAGASFDSDPRRPVYDEDRGWRPPLANELFSNREQFRDAFTRYGHMEPLIPRLLTAGDRQPLERMLADLEEEAKHYPYRRSQLAAVQYYLHYLITQCENQWTSGGTGTQGITNYLALLDRIYFHGRGAPAVMLVTFNYDRLLENAASHRAMNPPVPTGNAYEDMDSYFKDTRLVPILKLHGSIDWGQKVALTSGVNGWNAAYWVIENIANLVISPDIEKISGLPPPVNNGATYVPAMAIPVDKKSAFVCPPSHLSYLCAQLPKVTSILTVGWRGMEDHFLALLKTHLTGNPNALAVSGDVGSGEETLRRLRQGANATPIAGNAFPGGFSEFVVDPQSDTFLADALK